jgi:hypothetical protein
MQFDKPSCKLLWGPLFLGKVHKGGGGAVSHIRVQVNPVAFSCPFYSSHNRWPRRRRGHGVAAFNCFPSFRDLRREEKDVRTIVASADKPLGGDAGESCGKGKSPS